MGDKHPLQTMNKLIEKGKLQKEVTSNKTGKHK